MKENAKLLFVGEMRSALAQTNGYTWENVPNVSVHHSTKLFRALEHVGLKREDVEFVNAWNDDGSINKFVAEGKIIIAMGQKVQEELTRRGIQFIPIVHPAARGNWCKQEEYNRMLEEAVASLRN